jgi:hypothetical protein
MTTNINLVSDESNGHSFTAHFGEQIVIEPNSKCYLNFAALHREGREVLRDDATITLSSSSLLPRKIIDSGAAVVDNTFSQTQTIEAGTYSNSELQDKIDEAIDTMLNTDAGNVLQFYKSQPEVPASTGAGFITVSLALNALELDAEDPDFTLDGTNKFNSSAGLGKTAAYKKDAAVEAGDEFSFDNYATNNIDFWHYSYDSTPNTEYPGIISFDFDTAERGSLCMGLYGNKYATLSGPSTAPPATIGAVRPQLLTVDQPVDEVDPALGFSDSVSLTELGGSDILDSTSATSFHTGYKLTVSSSGSTTDAICYGYVDPATSLSEGVARIDLTNITGTITGLASDTDYDLSQSATSGTGSGFVLRATSGGGGAIGAARIQTTGIIVQPGTAGNYAVGDTITLVETTVPGTGSIDIVVTAITQYGEVERFLWVSDTPDYRVSDLDGNTNALSMGEGFSGGDALTITQGVTSSTDAELSDNATSACFSVPAVFLEIIKRGSSSQPLSTNGTGLEYDIYFAQDGSGNFIGKNGSSNADWTSQNVKIERMEKIGSFRATNTSLTRQKIALKTYYDTSTAGYKTDSKKLYFKIYDISAGGAGVDVVLYDSKTAGGYYFPFDFFTGIEVTDADTQELQVPFRTFLSAQQVNTGFYASECIPYNPSVTAGDDDQFVPSICEKMTITFSQNLADVLSSHVPFDLFPTSDPYDILTFKELDATLFWRNKSYYIVIEEMPLTNYKNKRAETQDGSGKVKKGMVKNILANIPLPFSTVASALKDEDLQGSLIGSVYDPPKAVVVSLKNQRIATNQLEVKVFRMNTDELATEIKQSIVNFTIMDGE